MDSQLGAGFQSKNPLSETYEGYVQTFKKAVSGPFTEKDLNEVFSDYPNLIMTGVDTNALVNDIAGRKTTYFPLQKLREELFYHDDIEKLLHSKDQYQRMLAYITLASAGDNSFNDLLLQACKTETFKGGKMWSGLALLYLHDSHTSELFDFLVENEEFGDAHMAPFYLKLDKQSIMQTAYEKISSKNEKAKILAVQSLAVTGLNPRTDQVVRESVQSWDSSLKGYAIYTVKQLGMGDLTSLLAPLLKDEKIRGIALEALANSPTPADQQYLNSLVPEKGEVPQDLLHAYLTSTREDSVRKWLSLICEKEVSPKYVFFEFQQPLLHSDSMLDAVKSAIRQTKNNKILHELLRALSGRKDDDSVNLLIQQLSSEDSTVRYWAGFSLKGCTAPQLVSKLPSLLRDPAVRTTALTELAIKNNVDGLQDLYQNLLDKEDPHSRDWRRSALSYLSNFPRAEDQERFRTILKGTDDSFVKRYAAAGLGRLHDRDSVDLIETALHQEPANDANAITYLIALGSIKGDKAKSIVESYKNSKNKSVNDLVSKLLADW
ncbi:MAG: HEAT repeat domain-containing protein [Cyanobacteria bacterium SZAS-4]|nr:HEAT repeat domain-containing protein [Cyanobacteria bacterium SZAS-4]